MEDFAKSEEELNLIREDFGSCSEFEILSIQLHLPESERISRCVNVRIHEISANEGEEGEHSKDRSPQRSNVKQDKITQVHGTDK